MTRFLLALPLALGATLSLFLFMSWMVDTSGKRALEESEGVSFNMVMVENEQDLTRRKRTAPEKPVAPEVPEQAPVSETEQVVTDLNMVDQPFLDLDTSIDGLAINAPSVMDFAVNQEVMPLYRVEPRYPAKALKRRVEGYVIMSFTIDETGKPDDIEVVEANPRRMFEREAVRALRNWKYQPKW